MALQTVTKARAGVENNLLQGMAGSWTYLDSIQKFPRSQQA